MIKFDWQLGIFHVDLLSRSVMFFSFLQSSCWDKDEAFRHKKGICIYWEIFIYIKSSKESETCWESGTMEVLKVISNGYFHENHLDGIINPKIRVSFSVFFQFCVSFGPKFYWDLVSISQKMYGFFFQSHTSF